MKIGVVPKQLFFDRPKMQKLMDRTTFLTLRDFGRYTRTSIRNSLKKKKGPSKRGQPPHSHEGSLKRFTFFHVDPRKRDVVVGPTGFGGTPAVPGVLEKGGMVIAKTRSGRVSRSRIAPRPFVNPAGERSVLRMPRIVAKARRSVAGVK